MDEPWRALDATSIWTGCVRFGERMDKYLLFGKQNGTLRSALREALDRSKSPSVKPKSKAKPKGRSRSMITAVRAGIAKVTGSLSRFGFNFAQDGMSEPLGSQWTDFSGPQDKDRIPPPAALTGDRGAPAPVPTHLLKPPTDKRSR
jgi:hypothetical protein